MNDKERLKRIIKEEVLLIKGDNNNFFFTPNDGIWIFDFRRAFLQGKFLKEFSSYFWDKYEQYYPFQVGGLELGSIPFVSGIIMEGVRRGKDINSFFVRKERKEGGTGNKIEGVLNNEKVIIVDDLLNSGKSINKVIDSVLDEKKEIFKIFTFVSFGKEEAKDMFKKYNLDYDYVFSLGEFGLDIFGNALEHKKENSKLPVIYPDFLKIYSLDLYNKFIFAPKSSPLKDGNNILFGGEGGKFISVSCDTGLKNWEYSVDTVKGHKNILSSPILVDNSVIFGSYDGNLYSLNKDNGEVIWKFCESDWIGSSPVYSKKYNQIYIGLELGGINSKGSLVGVDFESGDKKWEVFFDNYVHCSPGYSESLGLAICGSNDGKVLIVDGENGDIKFELQFHQPIKGGFGFSTDGKIAYFGCFDNNLYSLDLTSGNIIWSLKTNNIIYSTPLVVGDNIFFGSLDKFFYHLDNEGNLINKVKTFGKIFTKPILINKNIVAFGSNDSYIYFYDLNLNKIIFVVEHKERITTELIYDEKFGHLYVNDFLNSLYKYDLNGYFK